MRFATLLFLASLVPASAPCFAESWSGHLVDSNCYTNEENNTNKDPSTTDRDMSMELRACTPTAKTKDFAVVLQNWTSLKLDPAGNANAAGLVRSSGKKPVLDVTVTGDRNGDTIAVGSISAER